MELFCSRNNPDLSVEACAAMVIAAVPVVMGAFRTEMRAGRPADLSVSQFRALIFLRYHNGASVSDVAEHLDLALSSTSQLIDRLLDSQYVTREIAEDDRRRATLSLTEQGRTMLEAVRARAQARMESRLAQLSPEERQALAVVMPALLKIFQKPVYGK